MIKKLFVLMSLALMLTSHAYAKNVKITPEKTIRLAELLLIDEVKAPAEWFERNEVKALYHQEPPHWVVEFSGEPISVDYYPLSGAEDKLLTADVYIYLLEDETVDARILINHR